jgi:hypothetical protein
MAAIDVAVRLQLLRDKPGNANLAVWVVTPVPAFNSPKKLSMPFSRALLIA